MADEALDWLSIRPEGVYVDGTAGAGGHASLIASRLAGGRLLALDRDPSAVVLAGERLREYSCASVHHANYADMANVLAAEGIAGVDGVLIDAGCSSMQIDTAGRGFSFQEDGPLDMRMNPEAGESAAELMRRLSREEIETLLRDYGDVGPAGRIASAIKEFSQGGRLETTQELVAAVRAALPFLSETPDEVRTVFQAVRIAVNDELGGLRRGVEAAIDSLKPGGRVVVISFHSGEDRIVKQVMREASRKRHTLHPDGRVKSTEAARLKVLTSGPVEAGAGECARNPRAKSARLRAGERR
jgi:16S rRNA (cytosine1402-N4)-methyltransferase